MGCSEQEAWCERTHTLPCVPPAAYNMRMLILSQARRGVTRWAAAVMHATYIAGSSQGGLHHICTVGEGLDAVAVQQHR